MRIALVSLILLLAATWTVGAVRADGAELEYRTFDISHLARLERQCWGSHLGSRPAHWDQPERSELPGDEAFVKAPELPEIILQSVGSETWECLEGTFMHVTGTTLHVRNLPEVVEQVGAWLYQATEQAQARVLFAVEVGEGTPVDFPAQPADSTLVDSASGELPYGVQRPLKAARRVQYVIGYSVEIAQASNISDPLVDWPEEGLVADLRATPMLGSTSLLVEGIVQRGRFLEARHHQLGIDEESISKPFRSESRSSLGIIDLPSFDQTNVHWTTVAAPGDTIEVPVAWNGTQHTIRVRVEALGSRKGPLLDLSQLARGGLPLRIGLPEQTWRPEWYAPMLLSLEADAGRPLASTESLIDMFYQGVDPEAWDEVGGLRAVGSSRILMPPNAGLREKVERYLVKREQELIRPLVLDVRAYSVAGPLAVGEGHAIDPGQARLVAAGRLPTISGRMASIQAGNTVNFIADYDVEVAQEARISDPIVGQAFEGLVANLLPRVGREGRVATVDVELLLSFRTVDEDPPSLGAQFLGPLDRVNTRRSVLDTSVRVPRGGTTVIDLGPDPADPTRRLAVQLGVEVR